jgi:Phosphodiester glycosidase
MKRCARSLLLVAALAIAGSMACGEVQTSQAQASWLTTGETVAQGVTFYTSTDSTLLEPSAPVQVSLLRLDPVRVRLTSLLSNDQVMYAEPVLEMATRAKAVAAVNAGFFNVNNGEPVGLLKVAGVLVSDTPVTKGAVGIWSPESGRTELAFDQMSARIDLRIGDDADAMAMGVDGVDTTRARGKLMLYTPKYHEHTDTAGNGVEWVLRGDPLKVVSMRADAGSTPIPADGFVLSFGGLELPAELKRLTPDTTVTLDTHWTTVNGLESERISTADHVVNGAGLLRVKGRQITAWDAERLSGPNFINMRHPRTVIGLDRRGDIWLVVVDGRQPSSAGMAFSDLQRLADRLQLTDALNLDGGGSTTMVVQGKVVNRPSDAKGPRAVSDAIGVTVR